MLIVTVCYGVIGPRGQYTKQTESLARGGRARVETDAAEVLNNGFDSSYAGYDGEPLFSDSHPNIKGGGTQSNVIPYALTEGGLKEARLLMRGHEDEAGLKIQSIGTKLIVPMQLEYTAHEVIETDKNYNTDLNNKNVVGPMMKSVEVVDYLTDPDAWFLQDPNMHELLFFWRVKPEFRNAENIDVFHTKFVGRMRISAGWSNWRGIVGATGDEVADPFVQKTETVES